MIPVSLFLNHQRFSMHAGMGLGNSITSAGSLSLSYFSFTFLPYSLEAFCLKSDAPDYKYILYENSIWIEALEIYSVKIITQLFLKIIQIITELFYM